MMITASNPTVAQLTTHHMMTCPTTTQTTTLTPILTQMQTTKTKGATAHLDASFGRTAPPTAEEKAVTKAAKRANQKDQKHAARDTNMSPSGAQPGAAEPANYMAEIPPHGWSF